MAIFRMLRWGVLLVLLFSAGGCAFLSNLFPAPALYQPGSVPADVFDESALADFQRRQPTPPPAVTVMVHPDGRVEPGGFLHADEYQPESYGQALLTRLDLRSFPSLFMVPDRDEPVIHGAKPWQTDLVDRLGFSVSSSYAAATYRIIASFDYRGTGRRDWLVASSQQVHVKEGIFISCWLLVEDPQQEGPLKARLLGLEERRGLSVGVTLMDEAAARAQIAAWRAKLDFPPLAE